MSPFMQPEELAAAAAASLFLRIHMGVCSKPSTGTWPVGLSIRTWKKLWLVDQNTEEMVTQQFRVQMSR